MVLKSKTKKKIAISAALIVTVAAVLGYIYHFFFSTAAIKGETLMGEYPSPNSTYTVEIYRNDGGATNGYATLGVLRKKSDSSYARNIYWENNTDSAEAQWLDDDTVIINGRKIPNVLKDKYDFRYSKN